MYGEIRIYRPLKNIIIRERASGNSKTKGTLVPGHKIYIDRITRKWGRICFVRSDFQAGGDLHFNGCWIELGEDVAVVWAKDRKIERRQQDSL